MKKLIILSLLIAQAAWAITIPVPPLPLGAHTQLGVVLPDFNGISMQGQTLEIDFLLHPGTFVRLPPETSTFIVALFLFVDAPPVGVLSGLVSLLDSTFNPIITMPAGPGRTEQILAAALVFSGPLDNPLDVYGVRYSLSLPVEPISVTDCNLILGAVDPFLINSIPDTGHASVLLGLGALGILIYSARRKLPHTTLDKEESLRI